MQPSSSRTDRLSTGVGIEIERKFLVSAAWRPSGPGRALRQGYLSLDPARTVRVRRAGDAAWLTIKGLGDGPSRPEFEYPIPLADAEALLALTLGQVCKTRYLERCGDHVFEVDVFEGANVGLIIAEVELAAADEAIARPPWLGAEVTADPRYFNSALAAHPFSTWPTR